MAKTVTLTAPDGSGKVKVDSPAAVNNLVYGHGYKVDGGDVAAAIASLGEDEKPAPKA